VEEEEMVAESRAERVKLDCFEYLGFCSTNGSIGRGPAKNAKEGLTIEPATEVALEVYAYPDAQVRVYVRPNTPTFVILSLLEKIATSIELEQYVPNPIGREPTEEQTGSEESNDQVNQEGSVHCRHCKLSLHEKSSIRDALGPLCINCARELELL
jgi:hypothetical protein